MILRHYWRGRGSTWSRRKRTGVDRGTGSFSPLPIPRVNLHIENIGPRNTILMVSSRQISFCRDILSQGLPRQPPSRTSEAISIPSSAPPRGPLRGIEKEMLSCNALFSRGVELWIHGMNKAGGAGKSMFDKELNVWIQSYIFPRVAGPGSRGSSFYSKPIVVHGFLVYAKGRAARKVWRLNYFFLGGARRISL